MTYRKRDFYHPLPCLKREEPYIIHTPEQLLFMEATNRQIKETGKFRDEVWHVQRVRSTLTAYYQ